MRRALLGLAFVAALVLAPAHNGYSGGITSVTANDGGNWWDPATWEPAIVPNGAFDATLQGMGDVVLDHFGDTTVWGLTVASPEVQLVISSPLKVTGTGVVNQGTVLIADTLRFTANEATLRGGRSYDMVGGKLAGLGGPGGDQTLNLEADIAGHGTLSGIRFINDGHTIFAQGGRLTISPNAIGFMNEGVLTARIAPPPDLPLLSFLELQSTFGGRYYNTGGIIEAQDQCEVTLNTAYIVGGILRSIGSGRVTATTQGQGLRDVTFDGTLDIAQSATVFLEGDLTNHGRWNLNGQDNHGAVLRIDGNVRLMGDGEIAASDSTANGINGSGVLENFAQTISGSMRIEVAMVNHADGVLLANADGLGSVMTLARVNILHDGIAMATGSGKMQLGAPTIGGLGSWYAKGGDIVAIAAEVGTCGLLSVGNGSLTLENTRFRASFFRLDAGGSLRAFTGSGFRAAASEIRITDSLVIEVTGEDSEASWVVDPFTEFWFYGGLAADGCDESDQPGMPFIEVAGVDGGDVSALYNGNFEIPRLVVGPGARIQLADVVDNGNRNGPAGETEALYAGALVFSDADGRIFTNGYPLYYKNLIGDPSQIIDDSTIICGDATEDGAITATDALVALQAAVGVYVCPDCLCDVDQSGATTATDALRLLQAAVGQSVELICIAC